MTISTIFSVLGWAAFVGLAGYVAYVNSLRTTRRDLTQKVSPVVVGVLLTLGLAMHATGSGLVFVDQFEAGVVVSPLADGGVRSEPLLPGIHWIVPFVESVDRFSTAKQEYTMSGSHNEGAQVGNDAVEARTSDGQQVYIDATVRFYADPTKVVQLRGTWQGESRYIQGFVRPSARNVIYNTLSRYKVEEIYGAKRSEVEKTVEAQLRDQFLAQGLLLDAFQLRNITFSPEYAQSIEQKQIAQQQSEQAKLLVQKSQQEADQLRAKVKGEADAVILRANGDAEASVTRAKGDSEALKLIGDALRNNPDLLTYTYIQKLAPNVGLMLLPANGNNPFILDMKQLESQMPRRPAPTQTAPPTAPMPSLPVIQ